MGWDAFHFQLGQCPPHVKARASLSLASKIVSHKRIPYTVVQSTLRAIWKMVQQFVIEEVSPNLFLFHFRFAADKDQIITQSPWYIHGQLLVVKNWDSNQLINEIIFSKVAFWIQVHDLPKSRFKEVNVELIGYNIGWLLDIDLEGMEELSSLFYSFACGA